MVILPFHFPHFRHPAHLPDDAAALVRALVHLLLLGLVGATKMGETHQSAATEPSPSDKAISIQKKSEESQAVLFFF